ncbi:MAG: SRPBCC family protein [Bdellovibrionota bacterium]
MNGKVLAGIRLSALAGGLGLAVLLAACSAHVMDRNMDLQKLQAMRARLGEGDTFQSFAPVAGTDIKHGQIYGVVDAPIDRLWKVLTDYNYYKDFMPLMQESRIRFVKGNLARQEMIFGLTGIPLRYRVVVAFVHYPEVHRIEWVYVEGDIRETFGSWTLKPYGQGRTEVIYSLFMDLGGTVVGPFAQLGSGLVLPQVITALRKRVLDPRYDSLEVPEYARARRGKPTPVDQYFAAFD